MLKTRTKKTDLAVKIEGAVYSGFPLTPDELQEIVQEHTESFWERNQRFERTDQAAVSTEIFVRTVTGWDGVGDEAGKAIPCTDEAKRTFRIHNKERANRILAEIDAAAAKVRETETGNS